jgi:hypothetical protein
MNPSKQAARKERNKAAKQKKAETRQQFMAMLGHTVVEKEISTGEQNEDGSPRTEKILDFPPFIKTAADGSPLPFRGQQQSPPRLAFVGAKTYVQRQGGRKNRPGETVLHEAAIVEDASRTFAKEVDKILNPPQETPTVPVVPIDAAELTAQI